MDNPFFDYDSKSIGATKIFGASARSCGPYKFIKCLRKWLHKQNKFYKRGNVDV